MYCRTRREKEKKLPIPFRYLESFGRVDKAVRNHIHALKTESPLSDVTHRFHFEWRVKHPIHTKQTAIPLYFSVKLI